MDARRSSNSSRGWKRDPSHRGSDAQVRVRTVEGVNPSGFEEEKKQRRNGMRGGIETP